MGSGSDLGLTDQFWRVFLVKYITPAICKVHLPPKGAVKDSSRYSQEYLWYTKQNKSLLNALRGSDPMLREVMESLSSEFK